MSARHILVVDDEPDIRHLVQEILEDEGYTVSTAENAEQAREARRSRRPDMVLLDIWMPGTDGITLLKEWAEDGLDMPVVMMSGHGTVETAVEATRLGAYDFIEKPLSMAKLLLTVRHAMEVTRLRSENVELRRDTEHVVEPIGHSALINDLREQLRRIAQHDTAVLLLGEAGSGKKLCARYLHDHSSRQQGDFVPMNVAGLSTEAGSAELFGSEDQNAIRYGWLEQANGGTLFLNDIADMDLALQARLLSALQHKAFVRVGGREPVHFDTRIIATTSHDLAERVSQRRFRDDLYYHLNVLPVHIPALREHREDVPELLDFYVGNLVSQGGMSYRSFSVGAQNVLRNHVWPGNVRELKNMVQRLLILGGDEEIDKDEVDQALGTLPPPKTPVSFDGFELPMREAREQFEKAYLEYQLEQAAGNVSNMARRIGLERTHLYRKLKSLGIDARRSKGQT